MLLLLAINIFPLIWTIQLSFTNYRANRTAEAKYVGFDNYVSILTKSDVWEAMQATAHFVIWTIVLQTVIGFALAYLIDRKFRGHGFWTTVILIPMMLSPAVVGNFWKFLYQPQIGLFNYIISYFTGIPPSSFEMLGSVNLAPWAIVIVDTWMWTPYVMLICLAGLRSIPNYIYEAAEVDRASPWRQFWSITLPMALPFIMLAVLFRGIENFKMFDMVNLLTGGGPGSTTEVASITLEARSLRKVAHRLLFRIRDHPVRHRLRPRQHLREGAQPGEAEMTALRTTAHSVVEPSPLSKWIAGTLVVAYAVITMIPLAWILMTGLKTPPDSISYPPKVVFQPSLEGYCNLFTTRTRQTKEYIDALGPPSSTCDTITRDRDMVIAGRSNYLPRFINSLIIAFGSTFCAVALGVLAAYGFSRFKVPLADDLLFFILSTRMMPPIAVAIPDLSHVPRPRPLRHRARHDPALYRRQRFARGVAAQGLHRRDPARIRGSRNDRWLHAAAGLLESGVATGRNGDRRDRHLLPDLRVERIRVRRALDLRHGADGTTLHPDHHR